MFDIFKQLTEELNQTLLIVTDDMSFAERTHRIIEMGDGRIIRSQYITQYYSVTLIQSLFLGFF